MDTNVFFFFFAVLAFYQSFLKKQLNNEYWLKVLTLRFNMRAFTSKQAKGFRYFMYLLCEILIFNSSCIRITDSKADLWTGEGYSSVIISFIYQENALKLIPSSSLAFGSSYWELTTCSNESRRPVFNIIFIRSGAQICSCKNLKGKLWLVWKMTDLFKSVCEIYCSHENDKWHKALSVGAL